MIICVTNFCTQIGKTTISLFLAKHLIKFGWKEKVIILDLDKERKLSNLFYEEKCDKNSQLICEKIEDNSKFLLDEFLLSEMEESKQLFLVDLKSDLDKTFLPILKYSNIIISPFSNYHKVLDSTLRFSELVNKISDKEKVYFVENFSNNSKPLLMEDKERLNENGVLIESKINFDDKFTLTFQDIPSNGVAFKKSFDEICNPIFNPTIF